MAKRATPTTSDPAEGFDTAIFAQGKRAKEAGEADENPFAEGTHQAESWSAGYAEGEAPPESENAPESE